jgi:hypothetical protein
MEGKKLLVLDVDSAFLYFYQDPSGRMDIVFRPYFDKFIKYCFENYDVGIWSAANKEYVDFLLKDIFKTYASDLQFSWSSEQCENMEGTSLRLVKPLRKIWESGAGKLYKWNENNTLMIEDKEDSCQQNPRNCLIIPKFKGEKDDRVLEYLESFLQKISHGQNFNFNLVPLNRWLEYERNTQPPPRLAAVDRLNIENLTPTLVPYIAKSIRSGLINIEGCDLIQLVENPKVKNIEGRTLSIIVTGEMVCQSKAECMRELLDKMVIPVWVKISLHSKDNTKDNSAEVEVDVYEKVVNPILLNHFSPNLVASFGGWDCNISSTIKDEFFKGTVYEDISKELKKLSEKKRFDRVKITKEYVATKFLLLEKVIGETFWDWVRKSKLTDGEIFPIIFQILYTLEVFNSFGLRHNDLHSKNILVSEYPQTKRIVYFVTQKNYFVIPCKFLVKILDYDSSSGVSPHPIFNTSIQGYMCETYGSCNEKNIKYDTFSFLGELWKYNKRYNKSRSLVPFLEKAINPELLQKYFKRDFYRLCKLGPKGECKGNWEPSDEEIKTIPQILFMGQFQKYRKTLPDFDPRYLPTSREDFLNKDIYFLPSVDGNQLLEKLLSRDIIPIPFVV